MQQLEKLRWDRFGVGVRARVRSSVRQLEELRHRRGVRRRVDQDVSVVDDAVLIRAKPLQLLVEDVELREEELHLYMHTCMCMPMCACVCVYVRRAERGCAARVCMHA